MQKIARETRQRGVFFRMPACNRRIRRDGTCVPNESCKEESRSSHGNCGACPDAYRQELGIDQCVFAGWKAALLRQMKARTDIANAWLLKTLEMSAPTFVGSQAGLARRRLLCDAVDRLLTRLKGNTGPLLT